MPRDPEERAHLEWIGYVQPVGLLVSVPALLAAQAHVNRNIAPEHQKFLACLPRDRHGEVVPEIRDLGQFTRTVFGWEPEDLKPVPQTGTLPEELASLEVVLPEYHETLRPSYVVPQFQPQEGQNPWLLLVKELPTGTDFDKPTAASDRHWHASPQAKFERLLRETDVPIGLLVNGTALRLVYAPRGESSGYADFKLHEMVQVSGRPIFAALQMLLSAERLFSLPENQRLPAILAESRKYQNTVSTQLAQQVLAALFELLRGFQAADDQSGGQLLGPVLQRDPDHVYHGLLTVLMRLVFLLYAEDRGLLPDDPLYTNYYSVSGLFQRLHADAGRYPDSMDLRYGAWAQLLTLFRLIYEGGSHGSMRIPPRKGYLFDPQRYPFLEGRQEATRDESQTPPPPSAIPRISDGVVYRVLSKLLILDGQRLSYRTLDVEQIGSVYEAVMGFYLEVAQGPSIAIRPTRPHGAPATINLQQLLDTPAGSRIKWLRERTEQKLTGQAAQALRKAQSIEDLLAALDRKIAKDLTPNVVPPGAMVLQPSDERRRSGSHYTPRSLTEPIVCKTLQPILQKLAAGNRDPAAGGGNLPSPQGPAVAPPEGGAGADAPRAAAQSPSQASNRTPTPHSPLPTPHPNDILSLKICDPAMGSGAFLVEACRQLGEELVRAWHAHDCLPPIPPDEDEVLHARRLVAQRCLYGVDKNPMAVDLAKLSLWLVTLAKDHPFTFLDHNLRCGDSLVGLSAEQIVRFHWQPGQQRVLAEQRIREHLERATAYRRQILHSAENTPYPLLQQKLALADEALELPRLLGNAVIAAFFGAEGARRRQQRRDQLLEDVSLWLDHNDWEAHQRLDQAVTQLQHGHPPLAPFHWEIEFPEVFDRPQGGFDAFVGNPPFAGKNTLINSNRPGYLDWLKMIHEESHGNSDLVAHFFRRAFNLLRQGGCFGLIATNTIGQGDTRSTGLRWICTHGGTIYAARRRYKWPGVAAVVVSIVHVCRGELPPPYQLDDRQVAFISAYLFHAGGHEDPYPLAANRGKSFQGSIVLGMGFTFDDTDTSGTANPIALMHKLIQKNPRNAERIFPYIGGEEVNTSPTHAHHRYVINFEEFDEETCRRNWPELMRIVEERVKPERMSQNDRGGRERWWQFLRPRGEMQAAIRGLDRVLALSRVGQALGFAFLPSGMVYADSLVIFAFRTHASFALLQSRIHEVWVRFFASTLEERLRYTPSDCFETFPFPEGYETDPQLETVGREYYQYRAALMVQNNEGLTRTYNRFHDPEETSPEILHLRKLHAAMDRAVLQAYGWDDLAAEATCQFLLDYQEEEPENDNGRTRRRRKPWRYRWPDPFRDEVLARLLELNKQRAQQEQLLGLQDHA